MHSVSSRLAHSLGDTSRLLKRMRSHSLSVSVSKLLEYRRMFKDIGAIMNNLHGKIAFCLAGCCAKVLKLFH